MKKVAVILAGSGFKDGSEIRESVLTLLSLDQNGAEVQCFAPTENQVDVVNCLTDESMNESRNLMVEAARIARGNIKKISELDAKDFDGLIIPGGFGVAKNLCTFAMKGSQGIVHNEVQRVLNDFYSSKKMIGAICIAPAVLALNFKNKNLKLTLGAEGEAAQELKKLGHEHVSAKASECVIDKENKIATSPAYMYDTASLTEIYQGINGVVKAVLA